MSPERDSPSLEEFLTPRSKVSKMLADIEAEIDDAPTPTSSRTTGRGTKGHHEADRRFGKDAESSSAARPNAEDHSIVRRHSVSEQEDTEEEEDRLVAPRGPVARRMRGWSEGRATNSPVPSNHQAKQDLARLHSTPTHISGLSDDDSDLYGATPARLGPTDTQVSRSIHESQPGDGLFVSPARSTFSEDDLPRNPVHSRNRLAVLVQQKRTERLARQAEAAEGVTTDRSSQLSSGNVEDSQDAVENDAERILSDAARPTRKASRKALLEMERETQRIARQQALAHQMKVKKKFTTADLLKRFSVKHPAATESTDTPRVQEATLADSSGSNSDPVEPHSDGSERFGLHKELFSTPPSSPPTPLDREKAKVEFGALSKMKPVREDTLDSLIGHDDDLPSIDAIMGSGQQRRIDGAASIQRASAPTERTSCSKGKDKSADTHKRVAPKFGYMGMSTVAKNAMARNSDDDDLEVEPPLPRHLRALQNARGASTTVKTTSDALHKLRQLSYLGVEMPSRNQRLSSKNAGSTAKTPLDPRVLEKSLKRRAVQQARMEREERLAELRAKGIVVLTTEEREKEAEQFENLLERAREEAQALKKAERAALKGEVAIEGRAILASDDDSEDEEYEASGSDEESTAGIDGVADAAECTEDEEEESLGERDDEDLAGISVAEVLPVSLSGDIVNNPDEEIDSIEAVDTQSSWSTRPTKKRRRNHTIAVDSDDSDAESTEHLKPTAANVATEDEDLLDAFGFGDAARYNLMSPTQAFNATMQTPTQYPQQESMDFFNQIAPLSTISRPSPSVDGMSGGRFEQSPQTDMVPGSQVPQSERIDLAAVWQAPETPSIPTPSRRNDSMITAEETPRWEPTQDPGLPSPWVNRRELVRRESTLGSMAEDEEVYKTQETVRFRISESPTVSELKPRGRLVRRTAIERDEEVQVPPVDMDPKTPNAFDKMAKRREYALSDTERAEAERQMHGMMDEAAEESDDEYAGLGGDDHIAPETAEDRDMIDKSHVDVDEHALAALYAERERQRLEAEVSKLYKDITTGALRRRTAGGLFDVGEDEAEIEIRRRQAKQREEARRRKLLLQDENIAMLAGGKDSKGKEAFLKAIADDEVEEDGIDIDGEAGDDETQPSQEESEEGILMQQSDTVGPLSETSGNRRAGEAQSDGVHPQSRSTKRLRMSAASSLSKRPTSMLEVRRSVSLLLEEPGLPCLAAPTMLELSDDEVGGDDESDDGLSRSEQDPGGVGAERQSDDTGTLATTSVIPHSGPMAPPPRPPANQRRTPARSMVVDRLSLKRKASTNSSDGSASGTTSAWAQSAASSGFKGPSLLRRATTSLIGETANERGVAVRDTAGLARANSAGAMKNTGRKGSSLAAQARAEERRAILDAGARKREVDRLRMAEMRRSAGGVLRIGSGGFE